MRKAIQYAIDNDKPSVTMVHKGNIMKFTKAASATGPTALAQREFGAQPIDGGPWCKFKNPKTGRNIVVKDSIADAFLQQILLRPAEYSVIATLNLNGDYVSDALAAQVAASASRRVRTCPTASPCSRPPTAPRRSTPARTTSTRARRSSRPR